MHMNTQKQLKLALHLLKFEGDVISSLSGVFPSHPGFPAVEFFPAQYSSKHFFATWSCNEMQTPKSSTKFHSKWAPWSSWVLSAITRYVHLSWANSWHTVLFTHLRILNTVTWWNPVNHLIIIREAPDRSACPCTPQDAQSQKKKSLQSKMSHES